MHVIRLRRPWEKSCNGGKTWTKIDVPEIGQPEVADRQADRRVAVVYRRGFNLPSGLQPSTRVLLRIDGWGGQLESITVNGSPLSTGGAEINIDITDSLTTHNQILVRLNDSEDEPARMSGAVTLAIDDVPCDDHG